MAQNNRSTDMHSTNSNSLVAQEKKSNDYSEAPELSDAWFKQAKRASQLPEKKQVSLRIDEDILEFFKQQGSRYQTRMHAVLRAYVDGSRKSNSCVRNLETSKS